MRAHVLCIYGLMVVPGTLVAQTRDATAAQSVSAAFFKAMEAADWKAAAGFLDLTELERLRQSAAEAGRNELRMPPTTVERLMQADPTMPRAAAEWQLKLINQARRYGSYLKREFGVTDPDSLLALPIEVAAQGWLEAHDERSMYRDALRATAECSVSAGDSGPVPDYHIIGTIVDDSSAYTLFTQGDRGTLPLPRSGIVPTRVLQLRQDHGGWWVLPGSEMSGFMAIAVHCETVPSKRKPGGGA